MNKILNASDEKKLHRNASYGSVYEHYQAGYLPEKVKDQRNDTQGSEVVQDYSPEIKTRYLEIKNTKYCRILPRQQQTGKKIQRVLRVFNNLDVSRTNDN